MRILAALAVSLLSLSAFAREPKPIDDPRALAEKYLLALSDAHDQSGKDYLFGGLTLDAVTATAMQPEITRQDPMRSEELPLKDAATAVATLDRAGVPSGALETMSLAEAKKLLEKTQAQRKELAKKFPVLAEVIRYDRPLYWNPRNPARVLLAQAGAEGKYKLEYVPFVARSKDSDGKTRTWPLRIVRFKAGTIDTGWKVLPASEWDPE